jgi:hypothetical protein
MAHCVTILQEQLADFPPLWIQMQYRLIYAHSLAEFFSSVCTSHKSKYSIPERSHTLQAYSPWDSISNSLQLTLVFPLRRHSCPHISTITLYILFSEGSLTWRHRLKQEIDSMLSKVLAMALLVKRFQHQ